jgi:anti-sigma factor RsiW
VTCSEFLAELDDYIDHAVSAGLRADLERHLLECEHCQVTLNTTRKTIEIYREHELYELPESLRERLQAAILAKCRQGC